LLAREYFDPVVCDWPLERKSRIVCLFCSVTSVAFVARFLKKSMVLTSNRLGELTGGKVGGIKIGGVVTGGCVEGGIVTVMGGGGVTGCNGVKTGGTKGVVVIGVKSTPDVGCCIPPIV